MEKPNWTRNPAGDRPALRFGRERSPIPRQLGFLNEFGSEVQVSVEHARTLGLIDEPIKKVRGVKIKRFAQDTIFKHSGK